MMILCGTDFSAESEQAVEVAARIARSTARPLELVSCLDSTTPQQGALDETAESSVRARLSTLAARLASVGVTVKTRVSRGQPADVLHDCALRQRARCIVVGGLHKVGHHAAALVERSHVPVLVVRRPESFLAWTDPHTPRPLHILLGADTRSTTASGLRFVDTLSNIGPCELRAMHLFWSQDRFQHVGFGGQRSFMHIDPELQRTLGAGLVARFGSVPVEIVPRLHTLWEGLARAAERTRADVIVVGTRGRELLQRIREQPAEPGAARSLAFVP